MNEHVAKSKIEGVDPSDQEDQQFGRSDPPEGAAGAAQAQARATSCMSSSRPSAASSSRPTIPSTRKAMEIARRAFRTNIADTLQGDGEVTEPEWLDARRSSLDVHAEQLAMFGGADGRARRSACSNLRSARPVNKLAYDETRSCRRSRRPMRFGIARNHPFVDGNKRTRFASIIVFLGLNEIDFVVPPEQADGHHARSRRRRGRARTASRAGFATTGRT